MCEGGLIINACFLIALVATNPIPQRDVQTYPGTYCDQSAFRNSFIGSLNGEYTSDKSSTQIDSICTNQNDVLKKILNDRIINNPVLVDIFNDIQRGNIVDISNNIPNIVNNYIILPPDINHGRSSNIDSDGTDTDCTFNNPSICIRVKKDAGLNPDDLAQGVNYDQINEGVVANEEKNQPYVNKNQNRSEGQFSNSKMSSNTTIAKQKGNKKKSSKRPSQAKGEPTQDKYTMKSTKIDTELLDMENGNAIVNKTKNLKIKSVSKNTSAKNEKARNPEVKNISNSYKNAEKNHQRNRSVNSTNSRNKINGRQNHGNVGNGKQMKTQMNEGRKTNEYRKTKEKQSTLKDDSKNKQILSNNNRSRKTFNSVPMNQDFQFPNMPYNSASMYKYIDAIMSNYQLSNSDIPFNFNNFYQLPQLSNVRNKQQSRSKSQRRRKHPKFYRRKQNRKRIISKRKPKEKKVDTESFEEINGDFNKITIKTPSHTLELKENPYVAVLKKENETVRAIENDMEQKNNITVNDTERENIATTILDELSFINNSLSEEAFYNSYHSHIVGMDENVPIIFENSLMDDYYPDFTADNEGLLTDEKPKKYHGDKYHYVSNQNFDFGDYVKKRKRIAMKNLNKKINLFSSDTEGNKSSTINREIKGNKDVTTVEFLSPHFLDKPDFRTRKIDSNEIYEPYYDHHIYPEPEQNFKNHEDDKAVVYSTPMSAKDNHKTKSCNDIVDGLTKWRKINDSNVETVHARSKLAKYGLAL